MQGLFLYLLVWVEKFFIFIERIAVSHAGYVVGDNAFLVVAVYLQIDVRRELLRGVVICLEHLCHEMVCLFSHPYNAVMSVKVSLEEFFQISVLFIYLITETYNLRLALPYVIK